MARETRTFNGDDNEAYTEDGGKVWRWVSNDAVIPLHACEDYQIPCDRREQEKAWSDETGKFIAAYKAAQKRRTPAQRAEESAAARAAYGPSQEVVNVVTGERYTT